MHAGREMTRATERIVLRRTNGAALRFLLSASPSAVVHPQRMRMARELFAEWFGAMVEVAIPMRDATGNISVRPFVSTRAKYGRSDNDN